MIEIIVGAESALRLKKRIEILAKHKGEVVSLDDMNSSLETLEGYIFPSLFSVEAPLVHGLFLIEGTEPTKELLRKLVGSPTRFILEEKSLTSSTIKLIEKEGGIVFSIKDTKVPTKQSTIFGVTNALTAPNKKDRWLAYQKAISEHSAEALIGILYWKLRDLIEKSTNQSLHFKNIYKKLIKAHKESWQKGSPLSLAIEKVILEQ